MCGENDFLFAGMGGDRGPGRARPDGAVEFGKLRRVDGRRRHVEFQIAGDAHAGRAERQKTRGVVGVLREAEIDGAEDGARGARQIAPALRRLA